MPMASAVRSSASEVVAGTGGQRPGRSAGPQSGLDSCSSHSREWTDPKIWAKPTVSLPEAALLRLGMPAQHARAPYRAAHTLAITYPADLFHVGLVRRRRFSDNCTIRTLQLTIQHAKTCVHSVHSVDRGLQAFMGHIHVIRSHPNGCATALSTQPTSGHDDRIATRARRGAVVPPFSFCILLVPDIDASCHLRRRQGARRSCEPGVRN